MYARRLAALRSADDRGHGHLTLGCSGPKWIWLLDAQKLDVLPYGYSELAMWCRSVTLVFLLAVLSGRREYGPKTDP
jgi:hypothetical protein